MDGGQYARCQLERRLFPVLGNVCRRRRFPARIFLRSSTIRRGRGHCRTADVLLPEPLGQGYQANRLIVLNDADVRVHAMGKAAAAAVTLRSVETAGAHEPPMAYAITNFARLDCSGICSNVRSAEQPGNAHLAIVRRSLEASSGARHGAAREPA